MVEIAPCNTKISQSAFDETGEFCGQGQTDRKTWFLASTPGGFLRCSCVIPKNSTIFPIINSFQFMDGRKRMFKSEAELC